MPAKKAAWDLSRKRLEEAVGNIIAVVHSHWESVQNEEEDLDEFVKEIGECLQAVDLLDPDKVPDNWP